MESWKDNNLSAILEYPFDFERFIAERIREIDDLDERKYAKKILAEGLGKIIRLTEAKYQQLERRVYEELEIADNQYEAVMTIVRREHYDPTNGTLYPVVEDDLEVKKLAEAFTGSEWVWVDTIFLESTCSDQKNFEAAGEFKGEMEQDGQMHETIYCIRPAERYRKAMENLYQIFQDNHISWGTINTAYLDKFYDVFVSREEANKIPADSSVKDLNINFKEFRKAVRYGMLPLWNMEWVKFDSADFMLPCINGIYYEHEFSLEDKEKQDGYLIKTSEDILEIRHEKGSIVVKSRKETFENWRVLHMIQKKSVRSLDYTAPLLTNHKNDSYIRRFSENSRVQLMTKTDLFRRIMELDIREYIEVTGYEIVDNANAYPNVETMNWFVKDELFPMESRKVLLLKFEAKQPEHYLNDGMIRFVTSQMQLEISEYRCVGVMV